MLYGGRTHVSSFFLTPKWSDFNPKYSLSCTQVCTFLERLRHAQEAEINVRLQMNARNANFLTHGSARVNEAPYKSFFLLGEKINAAVILEVRIRGGGFSSEYWLHSCGTLNTLWRPICAQYLLFVATFAQHQCCTKLYSGLD